MNTPTPVFTDYLRAHQFLGMQPGPRLLVLGAVHGNEVCGTRAIERILAELESGALAITRGQLTLLPVTNPWPTAKASARATAISIATCAYARRRPITRTVSAMPCARCCRRTTCCWTCIPSTPAASPSRCWARATTRRRSSLSRMPGRRRGWWRTWGRAAWSRAGCRPTSAACGAGASRTPARPRPCWTRPMAWAPRSISARMAAMA